LFAQINGLVGRLLVDQLHCGAKVAPPPTQPMSDLISSDKHFGLIGQ
jgi:hypothetical protein